MAWEAEEAKEADGSRSLGSLRSLGTTILAGWSVDSRKSKAVRNRGLWYPPPPLF